jgi:hypothetical protein
LYILTHLDLISSLKDIAHPTSDAQESNMKRASREIPAAESAPALPSTPVQGPIRDTPLPTPDPATPIKRKFAKTLRLTSEQLVR